MTLGLSSTHFWTSGQMWDYVLVWIRCFKIIRPLRALPLCENDRYGNMTEWIQSSKDGSGDYNTEASDEWLEKKNGLLWGRRVSNFCCCHHIWLQMLLQVALMTSISLALVVMVLLASVWCLFLIRSFKTAPIFLSSLNDT